MSIDPTQRGAVPGDGLPQANAVGSVRAVDAEKKGVQVAQLVPPVAPPLVAWDAAVLAVAGGAAVVTWMTTKKLTNRPSTSSPSQNRGANVQVLPQPDPEEPKKKKKVKTSGKGEKVRTPDTHPDDFEKLKNGQGYRNNATDETWDRSFTSHKGDSWKVFDSGGDRIGSVTSDGVIVGP